LSTIALLLPLPRHAGPGRKTRRGEAAKIRLGASGRARRNACRRRRGRSSKRGSFMTVSMYKISVPIFVQFLTSLAAILDKTAAHCEAKKIEPAALLGARLFPDMYPLSRQVRAAMDHAVNATARLAGVEPPVLPAGEASFAELKERIGKAIDFVKGFKPAQIDGTEDKAIKITFPSGATRDFTGQSLLLGNSLPNFYFHCTTAYDIVRHCGVELGKRDFMGTPVSL
jgi:uncharacterized protein